MYVCAPARPIPTTLSRFALPLPLAAASMPLPLYCPCLLSLLPQHRWRGASAGRGCGAFARGCVMVASAAPPEARRPQAASCVPARAAIAAIAAPHALARQGPWRCSTPRHGACRAGAARRSSAYRPGCVGARCMPVACVLPARCTHAARRCLLVYYARASMLLRVYAQY